MKHVINLFFFGEHVKEQFVWLKDIDNILMFKYIIQFQKKINEHVICESPVNGKFTGKFWQK